MIEMKIRKATHREAVAQPYLGLIRILKKRQVSQAALAWELGLSQPTVNQKINRKNGRDFTFSEAYAITKILDVKFEDLF